MKQSDWLFAMLRNSSVLKNEIKTDADRLFLINLKYQFSKLQSTLRNMIKVMAGDIDRFEVTNATKAHLVEVLENKNRDLSRLPVMVDTVSNNNFKIYRDKIMVGDVVVFKDADHEAFIVAFGCLLRAKERQARIIAEVEAEERRLNVLSEFR